MPYMLIGLLVGGILLVTGSLLLSRGSLRPNLLNRLAGGLLMVSMVVPLGWLGVILGAPYLGKVIALSAVMILLAAGMVKSLGR